MNKSNILEMPRPHRTAAEVIAERHKREMVFCYVRINGTVKINGKVQAK